MEPEEEDVEIVPETSATAATDPRVAALHARAARELAADPLTAICFSAETARARGNACFGEGDVAGAVAEWTASVVLSGEHARCAESKALALANRSLARLHLWADARGAVMDAQAAVAAHPPYLKGHVRHAAALRCALGDGAKEVWHVLAAAEPNSFAAAAGEGCVSRFLDLAFARLNEGEAEDFVCACVALGSWLESGGNDAADAVLNNAELVDAWLAKAPGPKRCAAARLKSITQALTGTGARVWAEVAKRGADALLAKDLRDGDDDVRFAAWGCAAAAVRASPDAIVGLLNHPGVYEFLVSGPPPDDASAAKRIKHDLVTAVAEQATGMDDNALRALQAAAAAGPFRGAPEAAVPQVALMNA